MTQEVKALAGIGVLVAIMLAGAVFFLSKPAPTQGPVDKNLLVKGDSNKISTDSAKLTVVEFADFECPACGAAYPIVQKIKEEYKGKINYVFRHFPLPQHSKARLGAEAAEAAGEQGKFWEMHNKLYENQDVWAKPDDSVAKSEEILIGYAKDLNLDIDKFKSDVDSNKFDGKISADVADGNSLGVNSTPTFFFDDKKVSGVLGYEDFKKTLDESIK